MAETGHFATLWRRIAERWAWRWNFCPATGGTARRGADRVAAARDDARAIKAVCVVHNETSTGVTTNVAAVRAAIDRAAHPALLMVDTISSLGSIDYRHDEMARRRVGRRFAERA
jgi:alanine-glyoxylate transaminase/serine-glyoxylate transaminase/serine-pyruvate transaminase